MAPIAPDTVYTKTAKGILEIRNKSVRLARELRSVLLAVDGKSDVSELLARSGMTPAQFHHALHELAAEGYVKAVASAVASTPAPADDDLDFTSPHAMAQINMEAASRALAAADAAKRAQQEGRALLDARLRLEAEARSRALAEARAQAEADARARAEEAARVAHQERLRAHGEAEQAPDAASRAEAEGRVRSAAAAAVRAEAEARARAEAEARAVAEAETRRAAEEAARIEVEARARNEEQAQARAAAEAKARELLEAQVQAMQGVREHAANPQAEEAEAARAKVRELEAAAERARQAAREIAAAEGRAHEVPEPELDIADRVRQLNARVTAERRAREEAARQPREVTGQDFGGGAAPRAGDDWPELELVSVPPTGSPLERTEPAAAPAAPNEVKKADELPLVDLDRAHTPVATPDHTPSALERAMTEMARAQPASATRAPAEASSRADAPREDTAPAPSASPPPVETAPSFPAAVSAVAAEKVEPTIDDVEPIQERLNVDRAAHDLIAESAEARRRSEFEQTSRNAAAARRQRQEEEARRERLAARRRLRKRALATTGIALVAVPLALAAWLQFTPLDGYIPDAQRALSERLNQPVTVERLRYVLLPTPRLVLEGVSVGRNEGVRAARVEAHVLPLAALFGPTTVDAVHARDVEIDAAMLGVVPAWTGGRAADAVHVERLRLSNVKVRKSELPAFDGDVAFAPNGTLTEATFTAPKLDVQLTPRPEGVRVKLEASDWRIPDGPPFEFRQLKVNGLIDPQQIAAGEFTGRVGGGSVEGALTARWSGAVAVQGEFKAQGVRLEELAREMSANFSARGNLKTSGRFALQSREWATLTAAPQIEASFTVTRGELTNLDLVRAIQSPAIGAMRGGRTAFDELTGSMQASGGRYLFRQVQLASGPLSANGSFEVSPDRNLTGRVSAELSGRGTRATLQIGGTAADPQLRR